MNAAVLGETFGLSVPVVCAPMAGAAGGRLAAAVSYGGGLGMIGVGAATTGEQIRRQQRSLARVGGSVSG